MKVDKLPDYIQAVMNSDYGVPPEASSLLVCFSLNSSLLVLSRCRRKCRTRRRKCASGCTSGRRISTSCTKLPAQAALEEVRAVLALRRAC